ncbi:unnamed protein product [Ranitomeya imitator]|uniref:PDZ and LIM domain protein 3 n=1 Tax=Ranitomeya imitator TaxID=111125 RepID=A0ABN9M536_9NEOB|nr:unnamed protein product [Ranitomeya imitator]
MGGPTHVVIEPSGRLPFQFAGTEVLQITPGSKSSLANLSPGDVILAIDGYSTDTMTHAEAQERIKAATDQLCLKIDRAETRMWSPNICEDPYKINLEAEPQDGENGVILRLLVTVCSESLIRENGITVSWHVDQTRIRVINIDPILWHERISAHEFKPIGTAHNRKALPFVAGAHIGDKKQVVSSSYNTPIGLYSSGNIKDAFHGQMRGLIPNADQILYKPFLSYRIWDTLSTSIISGLSHSFFQAGPASPDWLDIRGNIGGLSTALQNAVDKPLMPVGLPHLRISGGSSTPSGFDPGSGRSTPSTVSTVSTIDPGELKAASRIAPNIPLEMELPGVKIVHAQFNTPMQLYSDDNIMESLHGQVSTILGEKPQMSDPLPASGPESDVYRLLHEDAELESRPRQSGSFRMLQDMVDDESDRPAGTRSVRAPVSKPSTGVPAVQKVPLCDRCGNGIVGTVVKAKDKFRHPDCFVCADCNLNLKQKGYFFVEGQLYCEAHARARMRPPEGYDAVTVYPKA